MTVSRRVLLLFDAYSSPHGGTEGQVRLLLSHLPEGVEAELWVVHRSTFLERAEFPCPTRSLRLGRLSRPWTWLRVRRLARDVVRGGFHLVATYMGDASLIGPVLGRLAGVPVVIGRRDLGFWHTPRMTSLLRRAGRIADGWVANANAVRDHVLEDEHAAPGDVAVVHNGQAFAGLDGPRRPGVREALGIPPDATVVILLANLKGLKRQGDLVEAAGRLVGRFPSLHVLLVGGGPSDDLRAAAARCGLGSRLTVHHAQGGALDLVREAAVGVLCSETEGLSNAVLEYMACGLPVVATKVGGTPELVLDGETGLLYPPGDVEALVRALASLLADEPRRARMGAAGRARFHERFGLPRMVRETVETWERAVARRPLGLPAPAAPRPPITVETVEDPARLAPLVTAWEAMLGPTQCFLTPAWVDAAYAVAGKGETACVLVARDGAGAPVGLLPLLRRRRVLSIAGASFGADHLDVVAAPGLALPVADAFLDHLLAARAGDWTRLVLRHLAEDGALRHAVRARRWRLPYREARATVCPYVRAEGTLADHLARLSAKHRGNLKRQRRALSDDPQVTLERVTSPEAAAAAVERVLALHGQRFTSRGERSAFAGPSVAAFHRRLAPAMAAKGRLRVLEVRIGGRLAASQYAFVFGGRWLHFQGGFDPAFARRSPGTALTMIALEDDVFGGGLTEYDFLDGDEAYKLALATGVRRLYDLEVRRPTLRARAALLAHGLVALARSR